MNTSDERLMDMAKLLASGEQLRFFKQGTVTCVGCSRGIVSGRNLAEAIEKVVETFSDPNKKGKG